MCVRYWNAGAKAKGFYRCRNDDIVKRRDGRRKENVSCGVLKKLLFLINLGNILVGCVRCSEIAMTASRPPES